MQRTQTHQAYQAYQELKQNLRSKPKAYLAPVEQVAAALDQIGAPVEVAAPRKVDEPVHGGDRAQDERGCAGGEERVRAAACGYLRRCSRTSWLRSRFCARFLGVSSSLNTKATDRPFSSKFDASIVSPDSTREAANIQNCPPLEAQNAPVVTQKRSRGKPIEKEPFSNKAVGGRRPRPWPWWR